MGLLLRVTTVRLHCRACTATVELSGVDVRDAVTAWVASHYLPVPDEIDMVDVATGMYVCTWRRQAAA